MRSFCQMRLDLGCLKVFCYPYCPCLLTDLCFPRHFYRLRTALQMEAVVHRLMLKTYKQVNIVNRPHASTDVRLFFATDIQQWRIQDFPEGGGGREHAKFSRKLHEIERIWTPRGGRASLTPPPRSANVQNVLPVKHRSSVGLFGLGRKSILHTEEVNHSTKSDALQTNKYHSDNLVFIMDVMCKSWKSE